MGHDGDDHHYVEEVNYNDSPDVLVEVAADLLDTVNTFWYDPFVLNKKSNNTNLDEDHHDTVIVYENHHDDMEQNHNTTN